MRFSHDRRGQSVVIGTVILFGFLILALSLYQVQVVPQQNGQVEFQHFEDVRNDLVELRAGVLQAGSTDRPQYQTVRLGTSYSTRLFAINPPAPAGTIRTTESYPITISNGTPGGTVTVPTRFIQYRPGYNEIDQSPTWYDASVLYVDARDEGGGVAVIEDQELVNDAGQVRIVALQNEFRRSGTGRVTLELRPAETTVGSIPEGDLEITIPTRLSGTEYWDEAGIPAGVYGGVASDTNSDNIYNLTIETTANNLTVDTVGVQEAPEDPTQNEVEVVGGGGSDGSLPAGAVAYDDADGDGQYDSDETAYTESDFSNNGGGAQGNFQGEDIVLLEDITVDQLDLQAGSFTGRDVLIETTSGDLEMQTTTGGIDLRGSRIEATSGSEIDPEAAEGSTIDIRNTLLISNKEMSAQVDTGNLRFNDPGTRIEKPNGNGQTLILSGGAKDGENGVDQPEVGAISLD